jgi:hypothetical protein
MPGRNSAYAIRSKRRGTFMSATFARTGATMAAFGVGVPRLFSAEHHAARCIKEWCRANGKGHMADLEIVPVTVVPDIYESQLELPIAPAEESPEDRRAYLRG